jgi:hypothetical protein
MASRDVDSTGHAVDLSPVAYVPMVMLRGGDVATFRSFVFAR